MSIGGVLREFAVARAIGGLRCAAFVAGIVGCGAVGCGSAAESNPGANAGFAGESAAEAGQAGMAGETPAEGGAGAGGNANEAAAGAAAEPGEAGARGVAGEAGVLAAPWNEHSQHVDLDCFAVFRGSMAFSADRADLSAAQLQLLDGLRQVPSNDECRADELGCGFAITSDRGDVTIYAADELDAFCGSTPALSNASVAPVLDGLGCKFALESAPALSASSGCFHGIHASAAATVIHQQLSLSEPHRSYHVEMIHCLSGTLTLELFGADPALPLAVGMPLENPGPMGACVAFDVQVQTPATADLVITTTALPDATDFYLNFR